MTAARIRAQFPTSDGFGYQLKGCCRPPFVWASYNISRYIGRHSSRENNVPYCSHYSSSNTVPIIQLHVSISARGRGKKCPAFPPYTYQVLIVTYLPKPRDRTCVRKTRANVTTAWSTTTFSTVLVLLQSVYYSTVLNTVRTVQT